MAGIWAGRFSTAATTGQSNAKPLRILLLDGARHLGAKILVAGGGRCNVTHDVVDESAFAGSSRHAIKKVLRRFDVTPTVSFFRDLGVELKREQTGKLFPTTDKARTVLDALLRAVHESGAHIRHPFRVDSITRADRNASAGGHSETEFLITNTAAQLRARRVILASGGKSLPKTGSDGHGYQIACSLGHSLTQRIFPALVPLTLPKDHFLCELSGLSTVATLEVRSGSGKRIQTFTDSTLCTHFGLSGPCVLDISRYFIDARASDPGATLTINWLPNQTTEAVDAALQRLGRISPARWLRSDAAGPPSGIPDRLARALCEQAHVDPGAAGHQLTREQRRSLAMTLTQLTLPITGDRGFAHAEVTAGGVPLSEIRLETMESRICPGLHLCGEICDVDGRIGGYNFQWAWASGHIAGYAAAELLLSQR